MVYPSHYGPGEYGLDDPNAAPGETVYFALAHFRRDLRASKAELIPWLQDFSYGRTYGLADVQAQIDAARRIGARGYLLWNPPASTRRARSPRAARLGREPLAAPAGAVARVADAVVQPVVAVLPELVASRDEPEAAPVRRAAGRRRPGSAPAPPRPAARAPPGPRSGRLWARPRRRGGSRAGAS